MENRFDLAALEAAIGTAAPTAFDDVPAARKAAVAAILRQGDDGADLLLIHRADHPRDPWSGHMAFPGGRVDPTDASPLATAVRETREEIGLDLDRDGRLLGRLGEARTHLRPEAVPHSVVPFVFAVAGDPPLAPNHEVQRTVWVPLRFLAARSNRNTFTWIRQGLPLPMPSIKIGDGVLWGLTLRLVDDLLSLLPRE